jgi:hypothetical protein
MYQHWLLSESFVVVTCSYLLEVRFFCILLVFVIERATDLDLFTLFCICYCIVSGDCLLTTKCQLDWFHYLSISV